MGLNSSWIILMTTLTEKQTFVTAAGNTIPISCPMKGNFTWYFNLKQWKITRKVYPMMSKGQMLRCHSTWFKREIQQFPR